MCAALAEHWRQYYERTAELPPPERTAPFLKHIPQNGTVLDFGCGTGRFASAFHRDRPDIAIHVLDINLPESPMMQAEWVQKTFPCHFTEFHEQQVYDGIFAWASLFFETPENHALLFARLAAALKPGGTLYFTFVAENPGDFPFPFYPASEPVLRSYLEKAGFAVESLITRDMPYGQEKRALSTHIVHARKTL